MSKSLLRRLAIGGALTEGQTRARLVATASRPPAATEVVVIGGGVIGTAIALFLARRGVPVTVCEKGAVAGEASGRSFGQIGSSGLAPVKMALLDETKRLWGGMNALTGLETGFRREGYLAPFADESTRAMWEEWLASTDAGRDGAEILSAAEAQRRVPSSTAWTGAFFNPSDGCAEPTLAASAFAEAAMAAGAQVIAPCAVRGLDVEAGRVAGVVTEFGRIRATNVILAGGYWARLFCGSLGLSLPLLAVHAFCESVYGVNGPAGSGDAPGVSWRRQIDGGYTICVIGGRVPVVPATLRYGLRYLALLRSVHWDLDVTVGRTFLQEFALPTRWALDGTSPFERWRVLEPRLSDRFIRLAREQISTLIPAFERMQSGATWSGLLCTPPDNSPTMSAVAALPGLYLATGFSYGLTMAPAAGALMADLITGARPSVDPAPYRYERYTDGTRLEPLA